MPVPSKMGVQILALSDGSRQEDHATPDSSQKVEVIAVPNAIPLWSIRLGNVDVAAEPWAPRRSSRTRPSRQALEWTMDHVSGRAGTRCLRVPFPQGTGVAAGTRALSSACQRR